MPLDTSVAIRRAAMDLLARREHGRVELTRKLRRHGADESMIEVELDRLSEEGLLSEARYLESFIASKARSGQGPLRIREELNQRGISRNDIEQALADADIDWDEQLREVWRRKFSGKRPEDAREKAKQGRFLAYRGYSMEAISRLISGRSEN